MNRWQVPQQVQYLLRQLVWADAAIVFPENCVLVTLGVWQTISEMNRLPMALVRPGAISVDPKLAAERPDLVSIEFSVSLIVATAGDAYGETTLLGANRRGGSMGRGLLEVEEKVLAAISTLGPAAGLPIVFRGASHAQPVYDEANGRYIAFGDYRFEAGGTLVRTYEKPAGLARTGTTTAILTWNQRTRWDFRRFILRRASGSTPPATIVAGTGITLGGSPDGGGTTPPITVTDTPGAGTFSYSLFQVFDDTDSGTDVVASSPQTLTVVVT